LILELFAFRKLYLSIPFIDVLLPLSYSHKEKKSNYFIKVLLILVKIRFLILLELNPFFKRIINFFLNLKKFILSNIAVKIKKINLI